MDGKQFVRDYLNYSRRERVGILVLVSLILVIFLLPAVINNNGRSQFVAADTSWIAAAKFLELRESEKDFIERQNPYGANLILDCLVDGSSETLFYFDPNSLTENRWRDLGIPDKTIRTIKKYLSKGGHFYKPEDLKKVYGLRTSDYERLAPYVRIENNVADKKSGEEHFKKESEPKRFSYTAVDINTADTAAFIALPGIGSKLAARIVNFREKLGGFYSVEQVKETYGIADSTFQKIKQHLELKDISVRKININTATIDELKIHPYIKYNLAKTIVAYRNEHGPFSRLEELKNVMALTDDVYGKVLPYLSVQ